MNISYITMSRMPTEKAHGVSIAHMCSAFAQGGAAVSLLVPTRANSIQKDIFEYYGVPKNFLVQKVDTVDFLGKDLTGVFFFFLQRLLFLVRVKSSSVPSGIVYTREAEIAWKFSKTHTTIFEAHRWPLGFAGWLQAKLVRNVALVVCNSHGTQEAARHFGVTRTLVAPNGYDPELFKNAPIRTRQELGLPEGVLALYAGSEREGKGADIARTAGVVVIADKEPRDVPAYLMSADILVLPNTREGESETFTSPIKLFEYLAAGKAIVASDLPSIREILKEGDAVFVLPGDPHALARAIETLTADGPTRELLAARARALSVSYTWEKRAENILATLHP